MTLARRVEENEVQEEISHQVYEVPQGPQGYRGDKVPIIGGGDDVLELSKGILERLCLF